MTTIYLVSDGNYSDYSVLGLYSTMEKAQYARTLYAAENGIEKIELDDLPPHPVGELAWGVMIASDGDVHRVSRIAPYDDTYTGVRSHQVAAWRDRKAGRTFYLWARDEAHAIKIATEKRREMLAMGTWQ
jgi:hypothetical protein